MIKKLILFLSLISIAQASMAADCYQYKALGEIKRTENGLTLIVNPKSASEYNFEVTEKEFPLVVPYVDKALNIEFILKEKVKGYKGNILKVLKTDSTLVDPLKDTLENRLFLQGNIKCP